MEASQKLRILLKDCAAGFYQQMYFLGKDVIHPAGNQLIANGFKKSPSLGLKGTSCYAKKSDETLIELYGSCAGLYTEASKLVFLRKRCRFYHWLPEHRLIAGQWSQGDIDAGSPEEIFNSLTALLKWWVEYEAWIEGKFGKHYREECYKEWKKVKTKGSWLPPDVAVEWVAEFLKQREQMKRPKQLILA